MKPTTPSNSANQGPQYVLGICLVLVLSVFSYVVHGLISEDNLMLWFLVGVIVAALYWGEGPTILVAFLSFLALDFGVMVPRFQLNLADPQYYLSLATFLAVGFVISRLSNDLRRQAVEAQQRAEFAHTLQQFSRDLTDASSDQQVCAAFARHCNKLYPGKVELSLGGDNFCETRWKDDQTIAEVESFTQQARLALQRLKSDRELRETMLVAERERVQNALLNTLSHDLQTPLASLAGSLQLVSDPHLPIEPGVQQELLQLAREQTDRLRRLVNNLLQITRLDGPGLRLHREIVDCEELVGVVLEHCPANLRKRILTHLPEEGADLELEVDYALVVNLLVNLLENAQKYTPEDTPIELQLTEDSEMVRLEVLDRGPGLPPEEMPKIFDKFYQAPGSELSGSGLGLFIAKGVVDAHQGRIQASLREGGGLAIRCWLPSARRQP